MKLSYLALILIASVLGCTGYLGEQPVKARGVQGPRDRYEAELLKSPAGKSTLYHAWAAEGRRALRSGLSIRPSFREVIQFAGDDAVAVGYRLDLRRGQRLRVKLERQSFEGRLFAELFEEIGTTDPVYRVVQSAGAKAREFSFEATTDGVHVLRVQPELMRSGAVAITVSTAAGLTFPVSGKNSHAIRSFFGDPRDGGRRDHEGIDIFADHGTPVIAVADGVITEVGHTNIGGLVVWQYDETRGVSYYYAHLSAQSVRSGERVQAGEVIGLVGNTGNARNTAPHLHFAVYRPGRVAIDPVPFIYDQPGDAVTPVLVDLNRLGNWTETARAATLHRSPASGAPVLAELPAGTRLRVLSGVREWHRVQLADGRRGFMPGQANLLGMQ